MGTAAEAVANFGSGHTPKCVPHSLLPHGPVPMAELPVLCLGMESTQGLEVTISRGGQAGVRTCPFLAGLPGCRRLSLLPFLSLHRFSRDPRPEGRCRARGGLGDGQKQLQGCGKTKSGASGGGKSSEYIQQGAIGWGSGGGWHGDPGDRVLPYTGLCGGGSYRLGLLGSQEERCQRTLLSQG